MTSILGTTKAIAGQIRHVLHPRYCEWKVRGLLAKDAPVLARLGLRRELRARVYPYDVIGEQIFRYGVFERQVCQFLHRVLAPGMVVFDLGANLGQYTLIAASLVESGGAVHSFEPNARMFRELEFNVRDNGFEPRCQLNLCAVSDTEGTAELACYPPGHEVYSSLGKQHWVASPITGYQQVPTITLDRYIREREVPAIHLVKMDIEGAELPALKGAREVLKEFSPALLMEWSDLNSRGFGYSIGEIWDYVSSCGYDIYEIPGRRAKLVRTPRPNGFVGYLEAVAVKPRSPMAMTFAEAGLLP